MFVVAAIPIAKAQKQPEYPLTGKWIKKRRYIHTTTGILFSFSKDGNSAFYDNTVNLEDMVLNEINQSQEDTRYVTPLT